MYIAMYSCGYTVKEVHVCVTHDTNITKTAHSLQQYCIITPEGRGKYQHVHIHICIYAQNSVYTVHTYVNTERISVLHWPHIVTAWASSDCTTHQQKHSHFQYDHWITMLQIYTSYILYTVFRVSGPVLTYSIQYSFSGPVCTLHTAITHSCD